MTANSSIGWDDYFLGIAFAASVRGDCIRRKVGAVLVDQHHIIRGLGYNGSEPGGPSCLAGECARCLDPTIPSGEQYENCIEKHAEENCIRNSSYYEEDIITIYITFPPCYRCKQLLYDQGIIKAIWPGGHLDFRSKL